jgi:hypothetical protein
MNPNMRRKEKIINTRTLIETAAKHAVCLAILSVAIMAAAENNAGEAWWVRVRFEPKQAAYESLPIEKIDPA